MTLTPLTNKQRTALDYIVDYTAKHGYCPTVREIAWQFGSPNSTVGRNHLKFLASKGYIELVPKCARAIRVLHTGRGVAPLLAPAVVGPGHSCEAPVRVGYEERIFPNP